MLVSGISSILPNPTEDNDFSSLFEILDTATKENDPDKRLDLIIKGCRIITAGFPVENRMISYFQQQDFLFYLIALEEFHPYVIRKIMSVFIEKLPEYPGLISVFYHSILEIAICPETFSATPEHKNIHQRVLEYNVHQPRAGLCKDIISKIPQIKLKGIDYWETFIIDRFQEIYTLFHRLDFLRLWIAFAINTKFEPIINRSCEVLEKMLNDKAGILLLKDRELARKVVDAHKKGAKYLKRLLYVRPAATLNFEKNSTSPSKITLRNSSPLLTGSNAVLKDIAASPDKHYEPDELNMSPDLRALEENQNRDYNCSLSEEFTEFESITAQEAAANRQNTLEAEDLQILFDEWLLQNEQPLISQDPTVLDFFNHKENYQAFFGNIFNPMDQECSEAFNDFAGDVSTEFEIHRDKILGPVFNSIDLEGGALNIKGKSVTYPESSYIFLYRAFKYHQVLLDIDNWKRIKELHPEFVSDLYMRFHQALRKKEPRTNIIMTLEIMDFFLKHEPDQSIVNIIYYNVPFILLWNLETSEARDIVCKLVNLAENHYKLSLMNLIKLSRYYRYTDFFIDFVQLIYSADYIIDFRKCTISYKPPALHKVYQLNQNLMIHLQGHSKKSLQTLPSQKENQLDSKIIETDDQTYKLAEEKLGLKSDIDGIKPFLNNTSPPIPEPQKDIIGPHDENVAQPIPRLNLLKVFSSSFKRDMKENNIKMDNSKSFTKRETEHSHIEQPHKSSRIYPSMFETALREDPIKEEVKHNKSARRLQEVAGSPQKKSRASTPTPSFQRRTPSITAIGKSQHERMLSSQTKLLENSRPGSSLMKSNDGIKHSRTSSLVRLLPGGEGEYNKHNKLETRETMTHSFYGGGGSLNSIMSMSQTIMNIYAMPSKVLGNTSKEPKFFGFRQNILTGDEEAWLKDQEKDKAAIMNNEKRAYPLAVCLQNFVQEFFERYQETKLMKAIGMKDMTHIKLIKALEGSTGVFFFSVLFKNYLLKMVKSSEEFESSGLVCGHIVNEILKRIYNHPNFSHISSLIHDESCKGIVYVSRLIAGSLKWKQTNKPKIYLQNYIVHETIGSNRLLLIRTLHYIILNDAPRNYTIINKVTEHCWQALVFWFLELKHQNMFQNLVLKIFEAAFKHGSEELILLLLLKANLLSPLWVAYRDIFQNGFVMRKFHVDNFVSSIKKLVSYIYYMETQRTGITKALDILTKLQSWTVLKDEFIEKNPFLPVGPPKEDIEVPPAVWINQGEEKEQKPKVKKPFFGGVNLRTTGSDITKSERFLQSSQGKRIIVKALNMAPRPSIQSETEKKGELKSSRVERSSINRGVSEERVNKEGKELKREEPMFNIKTIKTTRSQSVIKTRESMVNLREGASMEKRPSVKKMLM